MKTSQLRKKYKKGKISKQEFTQAKKVNRKAKTKKLVSKVKKVADKVKKTKLYKTAKKVSDEVKRAKQSNVYKAYKGFKNVKSKLTSGDIKGAVSEAKTIKSSFNKKGEGPYSKKAIAQRKAAKKNKKKKKKKRRL